MCFQVSSLPAEATAFNTGKYHCPIGNCRISNRHQGRQETLNRDLKGLNVSVHMCNEENLYPAACSSVSQDNQKKSVRKHSMFIPLRVRKAIVCCLTVCLVHSEIITVLNCTVKCSTLPPSLTELMAFIKMLWKSVVCRYLQKLLVLKKKSFLAR